MRTRAAGRKVLRLGSRSADTRGGCGGPSPLRVEGLDDATWVLLDYGDIVVHVFLEETRTFYDLERLWGDVPRLDWESLAPASGE